MDYFSKNNSKGVFILIKEEVELFPSGLVTCLLNENEVCILKISPTKLTRGY